MHASTVLAFLAASASAASIPQPQPRAAFGTHIVDVLYDGKCFYPKPVTEFQENRFLGIWFKAAGYGFEPTNGDRCLSVENTHNSNGTINMVHKAKKGDQDVTVTGLATPVSEPYTTLGQYKAEFPGQSSASECPGPNFIIQGKLRFSRRARVKGVRT